MAPYLLSPYAHFVENHLFPNTIQYGIFHQLSGEVFELRERVRTLLLAARLGNRLSLSEADLDNLAEDGVQLRQLLRSEILLPDGRDPLLTFVDQYVARPRQNPALVYRTDTGEALLVRISMKYAVYAPNKDGLPKIVEEKMPLLAADIFLAADGTRTLGEIFESQDKDCGANLENRGLRDAIEFLSDGERQLIKCTAQPDDLADPFKPVNLVPRDLYHASKWNSPSDISPETIIDFHLHGISDASWEFDLVEPTVNHGFRFPSEALGGFDYGSRFCISTLRPEVLPALGHSEHLDVLEVGGGTGSFARSFIRQAQEQGAASNGPRLNYHILDLSPALIQSQKALLSELVPDSNHFQQDATEFDLPGHKFDLIIANEVIADFPMASVWRAEGNDAENKSWRWQGDGAPLVEEYDLAEETAPNAFFVNAGALRFLHRAWEHLAPGGTLVISEYGAAQRYPAPSYHLNHEEFSIHFGHLAAGAHKLGFDSRLLTLKEFLALDDQVFVLDGREEHILCLNHVLGKFGVQLPYAVISKSEFEARVQEIATPIGLIGFSFSQLWRGYHFGPRIDDFMVLILNKP
jgi:SAM-dependent methyltransferase